MVTNLITVTPETSVRQTWETLCEHHISGAPVVDAEQRLVGVVSQTDLVRYAFREMLGEFPERTFYIDTHPLPTHASWELKDSLLDVSIHEIMRKEVITVEASDPVTAVVALMRVYHIHRVIVVEDSRLVGIVSALDLLKLIEE